FGGSLSDYPNASDNFPARLAGGSHDMEGWVRACAVFQSGCSGPLKADKYLGGWDGYIKMSGISVGTGEPYAASLRAEPEGIPSSQFEDGTYAWAGNMLGWISWCDNGAPQGGAYCVTLGEPEVPQPLTAQCETSPGGS